MLAGDAWSPDAVPGGADSTESPLVILPTLLFPTVGDLGANVQLPSMRTFLSYWTIGLLSDFTVHWTIGLFLDLLLH